MDFTATKKGENEIEVVKTETKETTQVYTVEFLKSQIINITAQKEREMAQRDEELANVMALLNKATQLGVKEKEVEEPIEEEVVNEEPVIAK